MSGTNILQTESLSKVYAKNVRALDSLSLTVRQGEVFGYLGPNGAGKTTTIRLLLDLIRPSSGTARLFGLDARRESLAIRGRIGYLPAELNLWERQTALQIIRYVGSVRGGVDMPTVRALAERLKFDLTKRVKAYSTGNKRKLGLILAMMNKPDLLILDEPTSGLDPLMQQIFYELVREARAEGRTVFLSSHILSEVQAICDRVAILRSGVLQAVQRVDELMHDDFRHVTVRFAHADGGAALSTLPGVSSFRRDGALTAFQYAGAFDPLLAVLAGQSVVTMDIDKPSLEEIFLKFYDHKEGDEL